MYSFNQHLWSSMHISMLLVLMPCETKLNEQADAHTLTIRLGSMVGVLTVGVQLAKMSPFRSYVVLVGSCMTTVFAKALGYDAFPIYVSVSLLHHCTTCLPAASLHPLFTYCVPCIFLADNSPGRFKPLGNSTGLRHCSCLGVKHAWHASVCQL